MGNCCSGGTAPKDPDDRTLDEIEIQWTRIDQFDSVYNTAADPLNTCVTLNNAIITSIEKIKEAAAAIFGANVINVDVEGSTVRVGVYEIDDDGKETELSPEKLQALFNGSNGPNFKAAWDAMLQTRDSLNRALAEASQVSVSVKKARLNYTVGESKEEDEARVSAAKGQIAGFNNRIFKAKLELMRASAEQALNPKIAMREIFTNLKKHVSSFAPRIDLDLAGIAEGNARFDVRMGNFDPNILPHKIKKAYLALFNERGDDMGLVPTIKDCIGALSGLMDQLKAAQEAVQSLPTDPSAIMDAAKAANLSAMFVPKVPGRVAGNTKQVANAPAILNTLIETIRATCTEIKETLEEAN
jgi:uncharacterized protein YukE